MTAAVPPAAVDLRGVDIPPFYAGLIGREAADLARLGRVVIPMHFGQPTAGTPPRARAAAAAALARDPTGYVHSRELAERISRHYHESYGIAVSPHRILLTNGASAALVAVFAALFESGDRIGVARPGYPAYRNALLGLGREPVEIDCGAGTAFRMTTRALGAVEPLHGLIVASPANPTGALLAREELSALAAACRSRGIRLLSDEIYHGISYRERAVSALEVDADAIVINSFSKFFRMPGWRLGWLVVPEALVARLSAYIVNFSLTPPTLSQFAALGAFEDSEELNASVLQYRVNRDRLIVELAKMGIARIAPPDGAFYLYADVGHLTHDSLAFCRRLLADTGVATAPGIDFDTRDGGRFIRLSFAVTGEQVEQALALLAPWLAARTGESCDA